MRSIIKISSILLASTALAACGMKIYQKASANVDKTKMNIHLAETKQNTQAPPVLVKAGYYVNSTPVSLQKDPAWLSKPISLRARDMPFSMLMHRILRNINVSAGFDNTVQSQRPVTINYRGPLKGALNSIASQLNYHYDIQNREVTWSAFMTKTFNISFMPGTSNYLLGQTQNAEQEDKGAQASAYGGQINDHQYSNLEGQLSVWQDLRHTLDDLKSKVGRVMVSESTTSVTVHDHPSNIRAMSKYIAGLNHTLSQEVAIKVQVLDIQLDKQFNMGINWNVVFNALNTKFHVLGNLASATNISASSLIVRNALSAAGQIRIGNESESNALIQALNKQGKLRVVSKPEVVTMNNQIASIRITQDQGYIKSIESANTQFYVSTSITPGTVTEGLTLYLLPKIRGKNVYMQISSRIANLIRIEKESNEPAEASSNHSININSPQRDQQYQAIELPTVAEKSFNIRSVVQTGTTLIIAGFKRFRDETSSAAMFGVPLLGGRGAESKNVETLVLITPIILRHGT